MKNLLVLAFAMAAGCGPSSAQLNSAHNATYKGPTATLFAAAQAATEAEHYNVKTSDPSNLKLETDPQWYTPDGQLDASVGNNISQYQQDSINLQLVVQFANAGADAYKVTVSEVVLRKHGLSSNPETMDPEDPAVPPWVAGKRSALEISIANKLKPYATGGATSGTTPATAAPATTPAPGPAPAPAPAPAPTPAPAAP